MTLIILVVILFVLFLVVKNHKRLNLGDVSMVTGGVKTGKSVVTLHLARKKYRKNLLKWRIKYTIATITRQEKPEKPLFYSNIKLGFEYVPMTKEIFLREQRMRYKSVAFVDEAALIADSMDWKDKNINEKLKMFNKLYGHETQGGSMFYNSQVMRDVHYAVKRCMNNYIYIHHAIKWIPFFYVAQTKEMFYTEEGEMPVKNGDPSEGVKWIIIPKSIYKKYDCYTYSIFTDNLPVADRTTIAPRKKDQKTNYIIDLKEEKKNEVKKKVRPHILVSDNDTSNTVDPRIRKECTDNEHSGSDNDDRNNTSNIGHAENGNSESI